MLKYKIYFNRMSNDVGEVIIIPKKGGNKVKRTYIEQVIKLLNLENYQDDN
ncbi:MAG: hypothetical protein AB4041_02445 [Microcystaceae cyanobacterium]